MSDLIKRLLQEEYEDAWKQGFEEGYIEGRQKVRCEVITNMLNDNILPEDIARLANIPLAEILDIAPKH